jgi:SAM-dependent methyltransferase
MCLEGPDPGRHRRVSLEGPNPASIGVDVVVPVQDADSAHFDGFADRYQELLNANLAITGETSAAFTERRMRYLRRRLPMLPARVMDFGCGIGLAIPHLLDAFPGCHVVAVDISPESVKVAREQHAGDRVRVSLPSEVEGEDFDLVYSSGVFHHIPLCERADVARFVWKTLRPGGVAVIAEHNPWNPATRYLVRTCPFDGDACLLRPKATKTLLESAGFEVIGSDYVSFFPGPLRALRRIEPFLSNLPLGAQYITLARRGD